MPRRGLNPAVVTSAAASLVDEVGLDQLSMGLLAERLGVKAPSLYKHVGSLAELGHRVAVQATIDFSDALSDAIQGRAGRDALVAGTQAMRDYARSQPGRYAAANAARVTGPDDPLIAAANRVMTCWAAMLRGYEIDPDQQIHLLRMLRSMLHGFSVLEAAGGFQLDAEVEDSFAWMIDFIDRGVRASRAPTSTR